MKKQFAWDSLPEPAFKNQFMKDLYLSDTATAYIFKQNGDTIKALLYYSSKRTLEKMQAFAYVETGKDTAKIYTPKDIKGYSLKVDTSIWVFSSLENTLNIASVLTGANPFRNTQVVMNNQRIFLLNLINGPCKLYKYISAGKNPKMSSSSFSTNVVSVGSQGQASPTQFINTGGAGTPDVETYSSTGPLYCIQKGEGSLIALSKQNIDDVFHDCAEVQNIISQDIVKNEEELKKAVCKYNDWKQRMMAPPTRY